MNNYRKVVAAIIGIEILILLLANIAYLRVFAPKYNRIYRVEAKRVEDTLVQMNESGQLTDKELSQIDLSGYQSIVGVKVYQSGESISNDYVIAETGGKLYQIEYVIPYNDHFRIVLLNISLGTMMMITIGILVYVDRKILNPFQSMSNMPYELAKGHLSTPVAEEKSKYFGKFLWGVDMLREKLEENKTKELSLQKEKKLMVLSLSHDIKTPLSAIDLYTKALLENLYDSDEKRSEALLGIDKNSKEIRRFVEEIISASREDFLNLQVSVGDYYLSDILSSIQKFYQSKLSLVHTKFVIDDYTDCMLKADRDRLIEVLQNIMENAIKYGDGKQIRIQTFDEEDCKLIRICNSGNSMQDKELTSIFDSFYRGSNSEKIQGNGLGLYICKNLMKQMDGDIFAEIKENDFWITVVVQKA